MLLQDKKVVFAELFLSSNYTFVIFVFTFCVSFQLSESSRSHIDSKKHEEAKEFQVTGGQERKTDDEVPFSRDLNKI